MGRHNNKTCKQVTNHKRQHGYETSYIVHYVVQVHIIEPAIGEICILQDIKVTLLYIRLKAVKLDTIITVLGSEFSVMLSATVGINV